MPVAPCRTVASPETAQRERPYPRLAPQASAHRARLPRGSRLHPRNWARSHRRSPSPRRADPRRFLPGRTRAHRDRGFPCQARDGLIGPGDAFCRPKRRGLWRQAWRHPMARSRRVRPIRARWLGQWLARSRCRRRSGRRRRIGPRPPGHGRVREASGRPPRPGGALCEVTGYVPTFTPTIAAITASNSGPDPRPPPRREHAILPVSDRIAARNRAEPTHIKWEYGQR